jgi:hypothetical protein
MNDDKFASFVQKYQRDLNRIAESDRNTRKRGLQKLLEDLPWESRQESIHLQQLCISSLFRQLFALLGDPVEKCREVSLTMYRKMLPIIGDGVNLADLVREWVTCKISKL